MKQFMRAITAAGITGLLAACGGGGGGSSPPPPPPPVPTISSVTPATALRGMQVSIQGNNLSGATAVSIGGAPASFTVASATQMQATVPATATTGQAAISVTGPGGTATASQLLSILPTPAISAISPTAGLPNSTITLSGVSLSLVTSVKLGTTDANYTIANDSTITFKIPPGAVSAPISISGNGFAAASPVPLTVLAQPTVQTVTAPTLQNGSTTVYYGARDTQIQVTGQNFDQAATFSIDMSGQRYLLPVVSATSNSATLRLPIDPSKGTVMGALTIIDKADNVLATPFQLASYTPVQVSPPAPAAIGQQLTLTGAGLDAVSVAHFESQTFTEGSAVTAQSGSSATFTVGSNAVSGRLVTYSVFEGPVTSPFLVTVQPRVWATSMTTVLSGTTLTITITGSNLDKVSGVRVGSTTATIGSQSGTRLVVTVPQGTAGTVGLETAGQPAVEVGAIDIRLDASIALFGVDVAQVNSHVSGSPALRLTRGKAAGVVAYVLTSAPGTPAPSVTVEALINGVSQGSKPMVGPPTLSNSYQVGNSSTSFNAEIPGEWVQPGLELRVKVGSNISLATRPSVAGRTKLKLTLVPLTIGSATAIPYDVNAQPLSALLQALYPYASADITIKTRPPLVITGVSSASSIDDWAQIRNQLELVRRQEAPDTVYYGFVPTSAINTSGTFTTGLAYINGPQYPFTWSLSGIGWDRDSTAVAPNPFGLLITERESTFIHELGHIQSRRHAPCGSAAGPDPNYPYSGAALGPRPIYLSLYNGTFGLLSPPTVGSIVMKDAMAYCDGFWFSDYSYSYVQQWGEQYATRYNLLASAGVAGFFAVANSTRSSSDGAYLLISGTVNAQGVRFHPSQASSRPLASPPVGTSRYLLKLTTTQGQEVLVPVFLNEVADLPESAADFFVSVSNTGSVRQVMLLKDGVALPVLNPTATKDGQIGAKGRPSTALKSAGATGPVSWTVNGSDLTFTWDAIAEPFVTLTYESASGSRSVLAMGSKTGEMLVRLPADAKGGTVEASLSDGVNARVVRFRDPR